ncbi:MAG TPA: PAS domain-containing protein [Candidatus Eisenbacteria bacterium]|nr:PAS domain-containing protein [Candidatus Eisenbacteria bacterium]
MSHISTAGRIEALRRSRRIFERQLRAQTIELERRSELLATEQERIKADFQKSETLLRAIIDTVPECVKLLSRTGTVVLMNPAGLRIVEADSQDQIIGKCIYSLILPEHREAFQSLTERAFGGESGRLEFGLIGLKGTRRSLETQALPLRDVSGTITSALAITHDITQRRRRDDELATRARQQEAVTQLGRKALSGIELPDLLSDACRLVAETLAVEFCDVWELLAGGELLCLRAAVGWREGLVGRATIQAALRSPPGYALLSEEPVIVEDMRTDARFSAPSVFHEHGIVSGMSAVILDRRKPFGVLGAYTSGKRAFNAGDVNFFATIATVISEALKRNTAEEDLRRSREALRALAARLQAVREEERTELAREIHDELSGSLTALKMDLSLIAMDLTVEQAALTEKIESMNRLIDGTVNSVRNLASRLRPGVLDDLGLVAAIEWQARDFQKRFGIACEVSCDCDPPLDREQSTAVFRILQETLTNVARHAGATKVCVSLKEQTGVVTLEIRDDGRGITQEEATSANSLGLLGIRERALAFGGEVAIAGEPRQGTTVILKMPVTFHEAGVR